MDRAERTAVMSTDWGRIVLVTPGRLTADDVADFEAWIEIVLRGMRRQAERPDADAESTPESGGRDADHA